MFPGTKYFQTLSCPFFSSGGCDRPYCHFKHIKPGTILTREPKKPAVRKIYQGMRESHKIITYSISIIIDLMTLMGLGVDSGSRPLHAP